MAQAIQPGAQFGDDEASRMNQLALLNQMTGATNFQTNPNTGVFGNPAEVARTREQFTPTIEGPAEPKPGAAAATDYSQPGKFAGGLNGFDPGKFGKDDPKYVFAKYASHFDYSDPAQRSALVDALRADPSGYFKNASLEGDILKGSYDPETGGYGDVDIVKGLKAGGQGWQWGAIPGSSGGPVATSSGSLAGGVAPNFMNLGTSLVPTDATFFNELMKRMQDGSSGDVIDRTALLQAMR